MAKLSEEQKLKRSETRQKNKEKKDLEEKQRRKEDKLQEDLKKAKRYKKDIPIKRTFKINDKVIALGARWKNCIITEVIEDRIYKISYTSVNNNYGNPIETKEETYLHWSDLKLVGSKENKESFVKYSLHQDLHFSQREVSDLISKAYRFGTDMNPDYQRDYVWEEKHRIALLDSMFKGIDIGKFVFIYTDEHDIEKPLYEILDGKQRMTTLLDFFNDQFQYKGYYFSELNPKDRQYLERYLISIAETKKKLSNKEKYEYFLALNISGVPQTEDQIKKVRSLLNKEK
jgi:hypothetical protein